MPRHYPGDFRRRTCERMLAGEAVKDLSASSGSTSHSLQMAAPGADRCRTETGPKSYEADPLLAARRHVKELEAELKAVKRPVISSRRAPSTQKEVPGCPRAEQPGLLRALRLPARRPRPLDLLRHQVQKAQRPRNPSPPAGRRHRRHPRPLTGDLWDLAGQSRLRDRTGAHRQHQAGAEDHG